MNGLIRTACAGAIALAALCTSIPASAQGNFDDVTIKTTRVAGNVYMLEGRGGNIGVCAGPDGILLIDDQFAPLADKIRAALNDIEPGPLKFILNTHYHGDHVGGNPVFGKEGTIIAHENVRKRVSTDQVSAGRTREAIDPAGWPVVTFEDAVTVHFNGEDIQFRHLPGGHTDGDAVVYFPKANVLHAGDLVFLGRFPIIDIDAGGSVDGFAANLDWIVQNMPADVKIIPGHGWLCGPDELGQLRDVVLGTRDFVRAQVEAGKSLDEIKQAGLPEKYAAWNTANRSTDWWIETLHRAVTSAN